MKVSLCLQRTRLCLLLFHFALISTACFPRSSLADVRGAGRPFELRSATTPESLSSIYRGLASPTVFAISLVPVLVHRVKEPFEQPYVGTFPQLISVATGAHMEQVWTLPTRPPSFPCGAGQLFSLRSVFVPFMLCAC